MTKYNAKELRKSDPTEEEISSLPRNPIYIVVDNVLDTYNIGSIFRLADAIAATKVYLCGNMEFPPSSRIHRAAVGTENWTPWEKRDTTLEVVRELKENGIQTVAVEQDTRSISWKEFTPQFPVAIVVGHETDGVSEETLNEVDTIVELPMFGFNKSFNVWGTTAIMAYKLVEHLK